MTETRIDIRPFALVDGARCGANCPWLDYTGNGMWMCRAFGQRLPPSHGDRGEQDRCKECLRQDVLPQEVPND